MEGARSQDESTLPVRGASHPHPAYGCDGRIRTSIKRVTTARPTIERHRRKEVRGALLHERPSSPASCRRRSRPSHRCGSWTRTTTAGSKDRRPAIRRTRIIVCLPVDSNHDRAPLQGAALPLELDRLGAGPEIRTPLARLQGALGRLTTGLEPWRDANPAPPGFHPERARSTPHSVGVPGLEPGLNGPKPLALTLTRYPVRTTKLAAGLLSLAASPAPAHSSPRGHKDKNGFVVALRAGLEPASSGLKGRRLDL